ncbi:MAG: thioredoxin family protein [Polyangiaceae bacterium]
MKQLWVLGVGAGVGLLGACGGTTTEPATPELPVASESGSSAAPVETGAPLPPDQKKHAVLIDDLPGALAKAKSEGKLVFVDAWATWCHTCLSMKNYVFSDASFDPYRERMVFVELDTDRDENAGFQDRYAVEVLPSFFVLDPAGNVLGMWPGSASVGEMREFLDSSLEANEALTSDSLPKDSPLKALIEARALHAASKHREAAKQYGLAVERAPKDWPRRSEALKGWIRSLARAGMASECVHAGLEHLDEVKGASIPADYANQVLACAEGLKSHPTLQETVKRVETRLTNLLAEPPDVMSPDDIADAHNILAYARELRGDKQGAKASIEAGLKVLEAAAEKADEPEIKATYDYGRAKAYLELGRPKEALAMLEEREKQIPSSAEPPARLSQVYAALGRTKDALAATTRAVNMAHGPRKLMYLERKSSLELKLGDTKAAVATLQQEVKGWQALTGKRARPKSLEDAQKRLAKAKARLGH